jgi:glutathione S-transferase
LHLQLNSAQNDEMLDGARLHTVSGLRHVAHALLAGPEASVLQAGPEEALPGAAVAASAAYLRDRVGVPRDLPLPAARQLRAHLNWLIDSVCPE